MKTRDWNYGVEQPNIFIKNIILGIQVAIVNCFITKTDNGYKWKSYTLPPNVLDYDSIANAIISDEYPTDKMQSVINNYLIGKEDPVILKEFNTMQDFRAKAKVEAKAIMDYVETNNLWYR